MTADLPAWAMEKAGAALGSPDFSRELLQIRVAYALVAERERAAGIARKCSLTVPCSPGTADGAAIASEQIATAILADGGPDAG